MGSYRKLFAPSRHKRLLKVYFHRYYLAKILTLIGITERRTQNQINLGLNCWNLCTAMVSSWMAGWVLRRRQLMSAYIGMTILFTSYTACSAVYAEDNENKSAARAVIGLIFLYNAAYNLMQPFQYLYIGEIFPFLQRSKGIAVMQLSVRFAAVFNQLVNPIGLDAIAWKLFLAYVAWLCVETTVVYFFFPETQGPMLEEIALVIEGDKAAVEVLAMKGAQSEERERA